VDVVAHRFGVYRIRLDPADGSEIAKTRPGVVVSPDEMNRHLNTVIIAPMTTAQKKYPTRVACRFSGKSGEVALDQIRTVDRSRLLQHLGDLDKTTAEKLVLRLLEMFG
jgi:mRNA interferase MazF